ncbi:MAG: hypothetical protein ACRDRK_20575 [Pseudonocardia sp.]
MSTYSNDPSGDRRPDPYELVERFWPYDGPYSDERTTAAAVMIGRLGRYLNNATQKANGLPYAAVVGRVLDDLAGAVIGYEQLLGQLVGFLDREAEGNPSLYDDRRDRPGAQTAREAAAELDEAKAAVLALYTALTRPAQLAYHLGSD